LTSVRGADVGVVEFVSELEERVDVDEVDRAEDDEIELVALGSPWVIVTIVDISVPPPLMVVADATELDAAEDTAGSVLVTGWVGVPMELSVLDGA
jgi:hypothetical protein